MKTKVFIVKCEDYGEAPERMEELLALLGGMSQFAKAGDRITLKVNLLAAASPDTAVCTHPAIVAATGTMLKKVGAHVLIADSPGSGYLYTESTLKRVYATSGMYEAAKQAGIDVNMDTASKKVALPQGKVLKRSEVINPVLEADGVFNLCKMKTHMLMHMTGAVKNNFGIIPGLPKTTYHARFLNKIRFADMLLDLALFAACRLNIMDAVLALEGQGPGVSGTPRQVGLLLASTDPLAIDIVAGEIMSLPREQNPVLMAAELRGLTPHRIEDVELIGADLNSRIITDYKLPSTVVRKTMPSVAKATLSSGTLSANREDETACAEGDVSVASAALHPLVLKEKCTACGVCRDSCPQKAIKIYYESNTKAYAEVDKERCICCYCCHEQCPSEAIVV